MDVLDFIPIVLAFIAIITCSAKYIHERRKLMKFSLLLSTIASILLIVAQTSWWDSVVVQNDLIGTVFANYVWLVFNILTTVIFITISLPFDKDKKK